MAEKRKKVQWDDKTIKSLRTYLGLTQREMADRLGTRQQTISEWEIGVYRPRGTSCTLLNMIAERTGFKYKAKRPER